jgi:hypothetical protein
MNAPRERICFHPPLEGEGRARRARGGVIVPSAVTPPDCAFAQSTSPLQGEVKSECGCATSSFEARAYARAPQDEEGKNKMRRKVSAADWRFPFQMTRKQWSLLPYPQRHAFVAQAQCNLLRFFRDCKNARCRRARCCLVP